jgi:predicted RNase H-like nuclease (RuvC/YqgF family)
LEGRQRTAMTDMDNELQQMRQELRNLRGEIEAQQHRIETLSSELEQVKQTSEGDAFGSDMTHEYR